MLLTTKNRTNTYYSVIQNGKTFDVWLVSSATGTKLARKASGLLSEGVANEFIEWIKKYE